MSLRDFFRLLPLLIVILERAKTLKDGAVGDSVPFSGIIVKTKWGVFEIKGVIIKRG